jgi:hypothetical protein
LTKGVVTGEGTDRDARLAVGVMGAATATGAAVDGESAVKGDPLEDGDTPPEVGEVTARRDGGAGDDALPDCDAAATVPWSAGAAVGSTAGDVAIAAGVSVGALAGCSFAPMVWPNTTHPAHPVRLPTTMKSKGRSFVIIVLVVIPDDGIPASRACHGDTRFTATRAS